MQYYTVICEVKVGTMYSNNQCQATSSYHASSHVKSVSAYLLIATGSKSIVSSHCPLTPVCVKQNFYLVERLHRFSATTVIINIIYKGFIFFINWSTAKIIHIYFSVYLTTGIIQTSIVWLLIKSKYSSTCTSQCCGPRPGISCRSSLSLLTWIPQLVLETMLALETQLVLEVL